MDINKFREIGYDQIYMNTMKPLLDKKALFSDLTGDYVCPPEPSAYEEVTIKFRTKKNNVDRVYLVCNDEK